MADSLAVRYPLNFRDDEGFVVSVVVVVDADVDAGDAFGFSGVEEGESVELRGCCASMCIWLG